MALTPRPDQLMDELSAPVGELISNVGRGVAEAQQAIDAQTIENLRELYAAQEPGLASLRDIGYRPNWYHIPELNAEINIALTISGSNETTSKSTGGRRRPMRLYAAPVDATYTNKYEFNLQAASKISFKIVPVPPSAEMENRRVAPALAGKTLGAARAVLEELGLQFALDDADAPDERVVLGQSPDPGTLLEPGDEIELSTTED